MQNLDRITLTQDADVRKIDSNFVKVKDAIDAAENNINSIVDDTIGPSDTKASKTTYSIVKISNLLVNAMKYQGQVATYQDLPNNLTVDNAGWLYNVVDTGDNYAWNGTGWDNMHGEYIQGQGIVINGKTISIDTTNIYNKTEVNTLLNNKQNSLTPGTNISIVNDVISATAGGNVDDVEVDNVSVVSNKVAKIDLSGKQDTLISGTNIKTINNESLLGNGNIDIQGGGSETKKLYVKHLYIQDAVSGTTTHLHSGCIFNFISADSSETTTLTTTTDKSTMASIFEQLFNTSVSNGIGWQFGYYIYGSYSMVVSLRYSANARFDVQYLSGSSLAYFSIGDSSHTSQGNVTSIKYQIIIDKTIEL